MRNQRRLRAAAVLAVLALAGLGACGRSDTGSSGGGAGGTVDPASKTGVGFDGKEITLGVLTPLTGIASAIGLPLTAGNEVYFNKLNAEGGVAGKFKVKLVTQDTKYDPTEATKLYGQMKGEVAAFAQILGTPIVNVVKDQLTADEILAQPATLDALWVKEPALAPFGSPYQIQMINGMDYAVRKLDAKTKKVCSFTKSDVYGDAVQAGYEHAVKAYGLSSSGDVEFKQGDTDFTAQINTLQTNGCNIVFLSTVASETGPILTAAAGRQFAPKWIGASPSWNVALANTATGDYYEQNLLLAAEGPNWGDETVPGMKEQMDAVKQYKPDQAPNGYFTFGYNEAKAIHQILEKAAELGDLTQQGIYEAARKIDKLTFDGVYGDYTYGDPANRDMVRQTAIFKIDRTKPNATDSVESNFVSEAAKSYKF